MAIKPSPGALWSRDSLTWRLNTSWFPLLGGPRAAILQICSPGIAVGVSDYSSYRTDSLGRLERTLKAMTTISFGTPTQRDKVLRGLERAHAQVLGTTPDGTEYTALDPVLQYWVLATLVDTVLTVERRYIGAMRRKDREVYFQESKAMADAFGIPERLVPDDLDGFNAYMAEMVSTLRPTTQSIEIAHTLLRPGLPRVPGVAFVPLQWITAELLPTPMRRALEVDDLNSAELGAVRSAQLMGRSTLPHLGAVLSANPFNGRSARDAA